MDVLIRRPRGEFWGVVGPGVGDGVGVGGRSEVPGAQRVATECSEVDVALRGHRRRVAAC
jgi:hypothetical protein